MKAVDFMTTQVVTVSPETPVKDAAALLVERGVGSAPVIDPQGRVVGVVAEVDLLAGRVEPDPRAHLVDPGLEQGALPALVGDVMTSVVVALTPADDELEFARLMQARGIRAIPVVESGRLVGIVSRRDLLRALARGDAEIAADVTARLHEYAGQSDAWAVRVKDGVVILSGDANAEEQRVASLLARTVPGVARVEMAGVRHDEGPFVDREGLRVMPFDECLRRLRDARVGRLAFHIDGDLLILPVNHAVDGMTVVFRTATGSKLSAAERADIVAFEVDAYDATRRRGWSVLVRGRLEMVYDETAAAELESLGLDAWADRVDRPLWVRLHPQDVSGREILPA